MKARYSLTVAQGNARNICVHVTVEAHNATEARRKALALTDVHDPRVAVVHVEEISA